MKVYLLNKFRQAYQKYGFFGFILLIISLISIAIGIYTTIAFISKISSSTRLINSGESIDEQLTGTIGEFIGGVVGTIWSFAGIVLFFLALRLQSKELSLQLEELKDTRHVFKTQQFENTFFNLLQNHNEIRLNTEIKNSKFNFDIQEWKYSYSKGNAAFLEIENELRKYKGFLEDDLNKYKKNKEKSKIGSDTKWSKQGKSSFFDDFEKKFSVKFKKVENEPLLYSKIIFKRTYNKFNDQLSHYFRNIYHILLYIKESEDAEIVNRISNQTNSTLPVLITSENIEFKHIKAKYKKYSQFLQAQMSNTELLLLFYNVLFFPKAKKLVQYYDLIENLNVDDLLYPETDIHYYDEYVEGQETIPKSSLKSRDEMMKL